MSATTLKIIPSEQEPDLALRFSTLLLLSQPHCFAWPAYLDPQRRRNLQWLRVPENDSLLFFACQCPAYLNPQRRRGRACHGDLLQLSVRSPASRKPLRARWAAASAPSRGERAEPRRARRAAASSPGRRRCERAGPRRARRAAASAPGRGERAGPPCRRSIACGPAQRKPRRARRAAASAPGLLAGARSPAERKPRRARRAAASAPGLRASVQSPAPRKPLRARRG